MIAMYPASKVPMLTLLTLIALTSSTIAGTFGFGGGMILVVALSFILPPAVIIPIHAAVQLASNSSRVVLDWRSAYMPFIGQHFAGSVIGVAAAFALFRQINLSWLPLIISAYILLHVWWKPFREWLSRFESLYLLGGLQSGIAVLTGAPGPIPLPFLLKNLPNRHQVVVTLAVFMTVGHLLKLAVFIPAGFNFAAFWQEIVCMCLAAIGGSIIGTKLRYRLEADKFTWVAKALLTLLATAAILRVLIMQVG